MAKKNEEQINDAPESELINFLGMVVSENSLLKKQMEILETKIILLHKEGEFSTLQYEGRFAKIENRMESLINNLFNNDIVEEWVKYLQTITKNLQKEEKLNKPEESVKNERHNDKPKII